jgi:hypothetical protein
MRAGLRVAFMAALSLLCGSNVMFGQTAGAQPAPPAKTALPRPLELEQKFFDILRSGDALQLLSYVPEDGINLGRDAENTSRRDIEEQLTHRTGLYCKLFDTSCLQPSGTSGPTSQVCSYRELLTQSEKVRTASTETTRNNVRQAILVAEVQNAKCGGHLLIDVIFNHQQGGWKLFSIP